MAHSTIGLETFLPPGDGRHFVLKGSNQRNARLWKSDGGKKSVDEVGFNLTTKSVDPFSSSIHLTISGRLSIGGLLVQLEIPIKT